MEAAQALVGGVEFESEGCGDLLAGSALGIAQGEGVARFPRQGGDAFLEGVDPPVDSGSVLRPIGLDLLEDRFGECRGVFPAAAEKVERGVAGGDVAALSRPLWAKSVATICSGSMKFIGISQTMTPGGPRS